MRKTRFGILISGATERQLRKIARRLYDETEFLPALLEDGGKELLKIGDGSIVAEGEIEDFDDEEEFEDAVQILWEEANPEQRSAIVYSSKKEIYDSSKKQDVSCGFILLWNDGGDWTTRDSYSGSDVPLYYSDSVSEFDLQAALFTKEDRKWRDEEGEGNAEDDPAPAFLSDGSETFAQNLSRFLGTDVRIVKWGGDTPLSQLSARQFHAEAVEIFDELYREFYRIAERDARRFVDGGGGD